MQIFGDGCVTMMFEDGVSMDFPVEAIEKQVKVKFVEQDE